MSSILAKVPPVPTERVKEIIKSLEDPNPSDIRFGLWLCLLELLQLRTAASTPTAASETIAPGGDERAAARSIGPRGTYPRAGEIRIASHWYRCWVIDEIRDKYGRLDGYRTFLCDTGREVHGDAWQVRFRTQPLSLAPSAPDGQGHAELAPAADPATPLGSAVGGPGFKPYED